MPRAKLLNSEAWASWSLGFAQTRSPEFLLKDREKRRKSLIQGHVYLYRYSKKKSHDYGAEFVSWYINIFGC